MIVRIWARDGTMLFKQEHFVWVDNRWVPSSVYGPQKRFESLSPHGKILLAWLRKRQKQIISAVEIQKCGPVHLRKIDTIRQLINELIKFNFVDQAAGTTIYSGRRRKEFFQLT